MSLLANLKTLKHQVQPCASSCYSTCVAMATGTEVNSLIKQIFEETGRWPPHSSRDIIPFLVRRSIYPERLDGIMRQPLIDSQPLIITTISKNNIGMLHAVLVYYDENGDFVLLDPCEGIEGAEYYSTQDWLTANVPICEMICLYDCSV